MSVKIELNDSFDLDLNQITEVSTKQIERKTEPTEDPKLLTSKQWKDHEDFGINMNYFAYKFYYTNTEKQRKDFKTRVDPYKQLKGIQYEIEMCIEHNEKLPHLQKSCMRQVDHDPRKSLNIQKIKTHTKRLLSIDMQSIQIMPLIEQELKVPCTKNPNLIANYPSESIDKITISDRIYLCDHLYWYLKDIDIFCNNQVIKQMRAWLDNKILSYHNIKDLKIYHNYKKFMRPEEELHFFKMGLKYHRLFLLKYNYHQNTTNSNQTQVIFATNKANRKQIGFFRNDNPIQIYSNQCKMYNSVIEDPKPPHLKEMEEQLINYAKDEEEIKTNEKQDKMVKSKYGQSLKDLENDVNILKEVQETKEFKCLSILKDFKCYQSRVMILDFGDIYHKSTCINIQDSLEFQQSMIQDYIGKIESEEDKKIYYPMKNLLKRILNR